MYPRRRRQNWYDTSPTEGVDLGFGTQYQENWYEPRVQILTPREPPKQNQVKYCSKCNGSLQWLESSRRFICYSCGVTYSELYDKPLSSVDQAIQPLQGEHNDKPVFISVDKPQTLAGLSEDDDTEITSVRDNGRIVNIRTNDLGKALNEKWVKEQLKRDYVYGY